MEILYKDAHGRVIERHSMYRPKAKFRAVLIADAMQALANDPLVCGIEIVDEAIGAEK